MCVRTALGAMRGRIVRQLLTESLVLAAHGRDGRAGSGVRGDAHASGAGVPWGAAYSHPCQSSLAVLGFACGLSLLTGVLFGAAPAWIAAQAKPADALRIGARTAAGGATLLQRGLVVVQAALSLVLLVGAGLFAQSLNRLQSTDLKLEVEESLYRAHQSPGGRLFAAAGRRALPDDRGAVPASRRGKSGHHHLHADGG